MHFRSTAKMLSEATRLLFQLGLTLITAAVITIAADHSIRRQHASMLYLYLTGRALDVIRRHGRVRRTKGGRTAGHYLSCGEGVYLSSFSPFNGGKITFSRDLKSLRAANLDDKAEYFVCFRNKDLVGVKATRERGVWLYPKDIELLKMEFVVGNAGLEWTSRTV